MDQPYPSVAPSMRRTLARHMQSSKEGERRVDQEQGMGHSGCTSGHGRRAHEDGATASDAVDKHYLVL
jgi:hypothetical protein